MVISTLLQSRKGKISLIAIVAVLIVYIGFLTWLDRVHRAQSEIQQYWVLLDKVCQARLALLPQFASLLQGQAQPLADTLNAAYKQTQPVKFSETTLNSPNSLQNLAKEQQRIVGVLSQMKLQVPTQISQSHQYQELLKKLNDTELQIRMAAHTLTKKIVIYNQLTYNFPQRWVNRALTHFPPKYFPDIPTLQ